MFELRNLKLITCFPTVRGTRTSAKSGEKWEKKWCRERKRKMNERERERIINAKKSRCGHYRLFLVTLHFTISLSFFLSFFLSINLSLSFSLSPIITPKFTCPNKGEDESVSINWSVKGNHLHKYWKNRLITLLKVWLNFQF